MGESALIKWATGGGSLGVVLIFGYIVVKAYEVWNKRRKDVSHDEFQAKKVEADVEIGASTEWRKLAQFQQKRINNLEERMTQEEAATTAMKAKHEADMNQVRVAEQNCQRLYNQLRIRCDRYEEAMRQANIPFEPFDSDTFEEEGQ